MYTALLKDAEQSTLNDTQEGPAWETVLKPVIHASRGKKQDREPTSKLEPKAKMQPTSKL